MLYYSHIPNNNYSDKNIYITLYLKCKNIKATPHNKRVGLQ